MRTSKTNVAQPRKTTTSRRNRKPSNRQNGSSTVRLPNPGAAKNGALRYSNLPASKRVVVPERRAESTWFVYLLYAFFVVGFLVIGALTYVVFLGT